MQIEIPLPKYVDVIHVCWVSVGSFPKEIVEYSNNFKYLTYKTTKISYRIFFSNSKGLIVLNEFRINFFLKQRYSNRSWT